MRPGDIKITQGPPSQQYDDESLRRKAAPLYSGLLKYFPDALWAVAELSQRANEKHNPGEPLHWSKGKSNDHPDCLMRHLMSAGEWDEDNHCSHTVAVAWRALAMLQTELEGEDE